jgi:DNA-binding MurR/RpiR family transcriptional regulator
MKLACFFVAGLLLDKTVFERQIESSSVCNVTKYVIRMIIFHSGVVSMTTTEKPHSLMDQISRRYNALTPKSRIIVDYVRENPRKAVFMTIAELARTCQVSEASVVRFVNQLGYNGYADFQQFLRDIMDTELTLLERADIINRLEPGAERFRRVISEEIDNLRLVYEKTDFIQIERVVKIMQSSPNIYVVGSRASYTSAYYLGWSLTKLRKGIQILKGSDKTTIDWLTIAPAETLVIVFATTRYPNELIHIAKHAVRQSHKLLLITDSSVCPLIQFAHETIIIPSRYIPFTGSPTAMCCLINYLIQELAGLLGDVMKRHQEKLEQTYLENDVLFNMKPDQA